MANETAATYVPLGREGTGYATILQNTILPSLQNEQRRADRLYQMEELAKQAAAKEAARDPNRDEGARIACNLTPEQMTLDPPPCKVFPSKKTNEKEQEENLYE